MTLRCDGVEAVKVWVPNLEDRAERVADHHCILEGCREAQHCDALRRHPRRALADGAAPRLVPRLCEMGCWLMGRDDSLQGRSSPSCGAMAVVHVPETVPSHTRETIEKQ